MEVNKGKEVKRSQQKSRQKEGEVKEQKLTLEDYLKKPSAEIEKILPVESEERIISASQMKIKEDPEIRGNNERRMKKNLKNQEKLFVEDGKRQKKAEEEEYEMENEEEEFDKDRDEFFEEIEEMQEKDEEESWDATKIMEKEKGEIKVNDSVSGGFQEEEGIQNEENEYESEANSKEEEEKLNESKKIPEIPVKSKGDERKMLNQLKRDEGNATDLVNFSAKQEEKLKKFEDLIVRSAVKSRDQHGNAELLNADIKPFHSLLEKPEEHSSHPDAFKKLDSSSEEKQKKASLLKSPGHSRPPSTIPTTEEPSQAKPPNSKQLLSKPISIPPQLTSHNLPDPVKPKEKVKTPPKKLRASENPPDRKEQAKTPPNKIITIESGSQTDEDQQPKKVQDKLRSYELTIKTQNKELESLRKQVSLKTSELHNLSESLENSAKRVEKLKQKLKASRETYKKLSESMASPRKIPEIQEKPEVVAAHTFDLPPKKHTFSDAEIWKIEETDGKSSSEGVTFKDIAKSKALWINLMEDKKIPFDFAEKFRPKVFDSPKSHMKYDQHPYSKKKTQAVRRSLEPLTPISSRKCS